MRKRSRKINPQRKNMLRTLFYMSTVFWLGYGIFIYYDMAVVNNNKSSADIATIYVLVNAAAMFFSGIRLGKQQTFTFYFALVVVIQNTLLTLLNLFDLVFAFAFILNAIILWSLMSLREGYLSKA